MGDDKATMFIKGPGPLFSQIFANPRLLDVNTALQHIEKAQRRLAQMAQEGKKEKWAQ